MLPSTDEQPPTAAHGEVVAAGYTKEKVRVAWDRRRSALADLAGVADELAGVDQQAAEFDQRITQLLTMRPRRDRHTRPARPRRRRRQSAGG